MSLDLALQWASEGHRVLPVNGATKRPLIKAWQQNCTTDIETIRTWWQQHPDARVGIATGEPGFDVLDFDVAGGKPGMEQLEKLLDAGVLIPGTFRVVETPSGGRHLYFHGSEQRNKQNDRSIPGVDFRGAGGMVVAAGNPGYRYVSGRSIDYEDLKLVDWLAIVDCLAPEETQQAVQLHHDIKRHLDAHAGSSRVVDRGSRLVAPLPLAYENPPGEESPLDWYCRTHDLDRLLLADGWTYAYAHEGRTYYVRPGKKAIDGVSANVMINADGRQTLMNYSTSVDLPTDRGLSAAQYMAYRDHGGDVRAAARAIRTTMMPRHGRASSGYLGGPGATQTAPAGTGIPPRPTETTRSTELVPVSEVGPPIQVHQFWSQRPELREVWWQAQVGGVSPWAVLGSVLAQVAARIGPHVVLPPLGGVGAPASLNLLVAVSGNTGTGKGRSSGIAKDFCGKPYPPARKPGTGQGIAAMFTEQTKDGPVQSNDTVILNVAEITQLGAHMNQQGATITSTLLEVYMGEELGEHYANKELRRPVRDGAYRLALVAGIQPGNSHILFDHAESGLPQRFIWMPAFWPDAVLPEGQLRPPAPGSEQRKWRAWSAILPGSLDDTIDATGWSPTDAAGGLQSPKGKKSDGPVAVPVKDQILVQYAPRVRHAIESDHSRRLNAMKKRQMAGEDDPGDPDSHLVLSRANVATLLAVWLDSTLVISDGIWELSKWVMWVSNDTRLKTQGRLASKAQERTLSRAAAAVAQRAAVNEHDGRIHDALQVRIMDRIMTIIGKGNGEWVTHRSVTLGLASRDKKSMREAGIELVDLIDDLLTAGNLERLEAEGLGGKGVQYRARR